MSSSKISTLEVLTCTPSQKDIHTPHLLFVHGACTGAWIWQEHFLPYFAARGFYAHALSLRGHGNSPGHNEIHTFGIKHYVEDLSTIIATFDTAPVLIGHSMGGFIVQRYLEKQQAPAAVLMCSAPPQGISALHCALTIAHPQHIDTINQMTWGSKDAPEALRHTLFSQPISKQLLQRHYRRMQEESQRALWDMILATSFSPPQSHTPLLIIGAEKDRLIPTPLIQQTAQTYSVAAHILPGLGHAMMLEAEWHTAAQMIDQWLSARFNKAKNTPKRSRMQSIHCHVTKAHFPPPPT